MYSEIVRKKPTLKHFMMIDLTFTKLTAERGGGERRGAEKEEEREKE